MSNHDLLSSFVEQVYAILVEQVLGECPAEMQIAYLQGPKRWVNGPSVRHSTLIYDVQQHTQLDRMPYLCSGFQSNFLRMIVSSLIGVPSLQLHELSL